MIRAFFRALPAAGGMLEIPVRDWSRRETLERPLPCPLRIVGAVRQLADETVLFDPVALIDEPLAHGSIAMLFAHLVERQNELEHRHRR